MKCFAVLVVVVGCAFCIPLESSPANTLTTTLKPGNLTSDPLLPAEDSKDKKTRREASTTVAPKLNATTTLAPGMDNKEKVRRASQDLNQLPHNPSLPVNLTDGADAKKLGRRAADDMHPVPLNATAPLNASAHSHMRRASDSLMINNATAAMNSSVPHTHSRRDADKLNSTAAMNATTTLPPKKVREAVKLEGNSTAGNKTEEHKKPARATPGNDPHTEGCDESNENDRVHMVARAVKNETALNSTEAVNKPGKEDKLIARRRRASYGSSEIRHAVRTPSYAAAAPAVVRESYSEPAPVVRESYSAPAVRESYSAPAVRESYSEPAVRESYSAPEVRESYSAPAVRESYSAPAVVRVEPVVRQSSYNSPAVLVRSSGGY